MAMADQPEALFQLAQDLESGGNLEAAVEAYRRGLKLAAGTGEAHHNLAHLLRRMGAAGRSLDHARRAAELLPGRPVVWNSLGQSLELSASLLDAEDAFRGALRIDALYAPAAANLGRLLESREQPGEAAEILAPVQAAHPEDPALAINLANAYLGLGRPEDALALLVQAVHRQPDMAPAHNSLGTAHYILRQWRDAAAAFARAIALDPDFAQARENLAQTRFQLGDYRTGWPDYEWRWKNPANALTKITFNQPEWDGAPLGGRTLLLHAEQGFGDSIQFLRFADAIKKQDGRVILACQSELVDLFDGTCQLDQVVSIDGDWPEHQIHAPLLSLPRILGVGGPWLPKQMPYLSAAPRPVIENASGDLRIGIAWAGRKRHQMDAYRNRSCRALDFHRLGKQPGVSLFSLQTGDAGDQCRELMNHCTITDRAPEMTNFTESAALVWTMDIVVTVDTALAHLAGALNKPCAVMLAYTSDWRWNEIDGRNPWYPSILAFRQPTPGDWDGAFSSLIPHLRSGLQIPGESGVKLP
jgi:tetratricopeptide (TPR) repeat protein